MKTKSFDQTRKTRLFPNMVVIRARCSLTFRALDCCRSSICHVCNLLHESFRCSIQGLKMTGLDFLHSLTVFAVLLCTAPTGGYVFQGIYDCEYGDNITDVVFLVKNIFNMKLNTMYDSRVGKYVGFGEYGMKNAEHYNSQDWKMALRRVQVEILCRYNARLFRRSTLDRKVPPVVRVRSTEPADYGVRTMLHCGVNGFYPQKVRVRWLRDGVEVSSDVSSTEVLADEDWSFQIHSYLELMPKRGERVSCRVEHSSLPESLEVDWETFALDAKCAKRTVGIVFFLLGFCAAAGGAVYSWWRRRSDFSPVDRRGQTSSCLSEF